MAVTETHNGKVHLDLTPSRGYEPLPIGEQDRVTVTVLMADIRGFSGIAQQADPLTVATQISEHRARMIRAIDQAGGALTRFIGDCSMAVFGTPLPYADHADRALRAAVAMHAAQDALNQQWRERGLPSFHLGIGLSSGEVVATLMGPIDRLEFDFVGDCVNLAHRLQHLAKGGDTVLSDAALSALSQEVCVRRLGPIPIKGRPDPVTTFVLA